LVHQRGWDDRWNRRWRDQLGYGYEYCGEHARRGRSPRPAPAPSWSPSSPSSSLAEWRLAVVLGLVVEPTPKFKEFGGPVKRSARFSLRRFGTARL